MKIFFVRHGETEYNATNRISGQADIPLTKKGVEQAQLLSMEIPGGISVIYSSDLIRCKQTADILNKKLNVQIIYDVRLRERGAGSLEGKEWSVVDPDGNMKKMNSNLKYDFRQYGGESIEGVKKRIFACIDDIRKEKKGSAVLVVTSAGVIRLLHHSVNNQLHEVIHNSSIHEFEFPDTQ